MTAQAQNWGSVFISPGKDISSIHRALELSLWIIVFPEFLGVGHTAGQKSRRISKRAHFPEGLCCGQIGARCPFPSCVCSYYYIPMLMPVFVDARRHGGHVRLCLVITAQRLGCGCPTDVFLMSFLPGKYLCIFAPLKGTKKKRESRSKGLTWASPEEVVPVPPRLLSSCYVHFHQKQAKWKMPSPPFSSPETCQDL